MKRRSAALLALALLAGLAHAKQPTASQLTVIQSPVNRPSAQYTLQVSFAGAPALIYNREGGSVLRITTAAFTREVKLSGVVDPDDAHYWSSLSPVRVRLPVSAEPLTLHTRLYVCDKTAGLCSVREHDQSVLPGPGRTFTVVLVTGEFLRP